MHSGSNTRQQIVDFILAWFGSHTGKFLDIGAHDGKGSSITVPLLLRGWHGVMVEPTPYTYRTLVSHLSKLGLSHNTTCVPKAVLPDQSWGQHISMYDMVNLGENDNSGYASIYRNRVVSNRHQIQAELRTTASKIHDIWVPCVTAQSLIEQHGYDWDLIKIDAEGCDINIFKSLPLDSMRIGLVCLEYDMDLPLVLAQKWRICARFGGNIMLYRS
jgi:FkbM family methyltransferase